MAARRGKSQARRNGSSNGTPGWVWLVAGAAIAAVVFLAAPGLFKKDGDGFLRVGPQPNPDAQPAPVADADIDAGTELPRPATRDSKPADKPAATQYDFYTVLPGNEVRMSDAELAASTRAEQARREQDEARRAREALEGRSTTPVAVDTAVATSAPAPAPVADAPAAQPAPARLISGAPVQPLLRHRVIPIVGRLRDEGHEPRRLDPHDIVGPARLDQAHRARSILGQPAGRCAPRAAAADNDDIELIPKTHARRSPRHQFGGQSGLT